MRTFSIFIFATLLALGPACTSHSAKVGAVTKDRVGDTYTLFEVTDARYGLEDEVQYCIFTAETPKEGAKAKAFSLCPRIGELVQRQDCCDLINWGPTDHLHAALVTKKWAKQKDPPYRGKDYFDMLFAPKYITQTVLGIVGVIGIVIGICTLRTINRQTDVMVIQTEIAETNARAAFLGVDAARKSAEAARMNAQAVIDSERPWLVVSVHRDPDAQKGFFFRITNKGRTPATLVSAYLHTAFQAGSPDRLPIPPRYDSPMYSPEDDLIVPGGEWNNPPSFDPESIIGPAGTGTKREALENADEFLCFYGQVTYRDSLGKGEEHYTRWCYVYSNFNKAMGRSGPREYCKKT